MLIDDRSDHLEDHSVGQDYIDTINVDEEDFGRYKTFEHKFPFYRMDVNGFIFHIDHAMIDSEKDEEDGG